jgi:hypothetical protein
MAKKLAWSKVHVPEHPRVRFFVKTGDPTVKFRDVTKEVSKIVIEDPEDDSGYCALLRLNAEGQLVCKTRHPSEQETRWHAEFEYGLPEKKWTLFEPGGRKTGPKP